MKLEKLTPEQEALMPVIRDKWINLSLNGPRLEYSQELKEGINWIYKKAKLKEDPLIIISDSPYSAQIIANLLHKTDLLKNINITLKDIPKKRGDSVWVSVRDSVRDSVRVSVRDSVGVSVRDSVGDSVRDSVGDSVWDSVGDSVWDSVRVSVWDSVRDSVRDSITPKLEFYSVYNGLDYSSDWISFYDYFDTIKILDDEDFRKYRDIFGLGIFNALLFENVVILSRTPEKVLKADDKLHSTSSPSISFRDGFSLYHIHGVKFEKELWEKVSKRQLTPKEVMQIKNVEQRRVAINHYGWDEIFDYFDKTLINKSKRNSKAELYRVKGLAERVEINIVRYKDPSTNRWYVSQVPDNDDYNKEIKTADHAMAWKSYLSLEDYTKHLSIEA